MMRRPPRSTLFPTRRSSDLGLRRDLRAKAVGEVRVDLLPRRVGCEQVYADLTDGRSEEHTSELQSLRHLVCRLLLEKKKKHLRKRLMVCQQREVDYGVSA